MRSTFRSQTSRKPVYSTSYKRDKYIPQQLSLLSGSRKYDFVKHDNASYSTWIRIPSNDGIIKETETDETKILIYMYLSFSRCVGTQYIALKMKNAKSSFTLEQHFSSYLYLTLIHSVVHRITVSCLIYLI